MPLSAPDLTQRPPRSPRVRLGGYVLLPRMLDKCRALLAGKNGEYNYDCPMDQHFFEFAGIEAEALKAQVASGKSDSEILEWITLNSKTKLSPSVIAAWSSYQEHRAPSDPEGREFFQEEHRRLAPHRTDLETWFDYLDLDDFVFFGGKA
jgi:hypothetical protein